ncbi:hypothetical protein [Zavarzinia sp.]|uniref:hypothetical protein n=1 Tax=Zavarzinia sp. TaxID=2027920 RepID=UPI003BB71E2E
MRDPSKIEASIGSAMNALLLFCLALSVFAFTKDESKILEAARQDLQLLSTIRIFPDTVEAAIIKTIPAHITKIRAIFDETVARNSPEEGDGPPIIHSSKVLELENIVRIEKGPTSLTCVENVSTCLDAATKIARQQNFSISIPDEEQLAVAYRRFTRRWQNDSSLPGGEIVGVTFGCGWAFNQCNVSVHLKNSVDARPILLTELYVDRVQIEGPSTLDIYEAVHPGIAGILEASSLRPFAFEIGGKSFAEAIFLIQQKINKEKENSNGTQIFGFNINSDVLRNIYAGIICGILFYIFLLLSDLLITMKMINEKIAHEGIVFPHNGPRLTISIICLIVIPSISIFAFSSRFQDNIDYWSMLMASMISLLNLIIASIIIETGNISTGGFRSYLAAIRRRYSGS